MTETKQKLKEEFTSIRKAFIHFNNDPSVGMFPYGFECEVSLDANDKERLEEAREAIKNLYEILEGEKPSWVMFDVEIQAQNEAEAQMEAERPNEEVAWQEESQKLLHDEHEKERSVEDNLDYLSMHNERVIKNFI